MVDNQYRVLVVDDELSMRELLEYMLEKQGYGVLRRGQWERGDF